MVRQAGLDAEERTAEREQDDEHCHTADDRAAHDGHREAVPEAVLPAGGPAPERPAIEIRAERSDHRRKDDHRGDRRERHNGDAGVGEGPHEDRREDQQRRQGSGDGDGAEGHRPPCGHDHTDDRVLVRETAGTLLAVAGDHEQAVVDGETQAEGRGEVQREHRDVHHLAENAQQPERADDRDRADDERQRRGDDAPEDQEGQDDQERGREHLGALEVLLDLDLRLTRDLRGPADPAGQRPALDGVLRADALDHLLNAIVIATDVRQDERLLAVVAAQRRDGRARPVRPDLVDALLGAEPLGKRTALCCRRRRVDGAAGRARQDHEVRRSHAEILEQRVPRPLGLRARVGVAAGGESVDHPGAEAAGEHDGDDGAYQHPSASADGVQGEPSEHMEPPQKCERVRRVERGLRRMPARAGPSAGA